MSSSLPLSLNQFEKEEVTANLLAETDIIHPGQKSAIRDAWLPDEDPVLAIGLL